MKSLRLHVVFLDPFTCRAFMLFRQNSGFTLCCMLLLAVKAAEERLSHFLLFFLVFLFFRVDVDCLMLSS